MANFAWLLNAVAGAPSNTGRTVRQAMSVALGGATAARPLGARSGVRPGTPASTVALPTATSYVIHPHAGVLDTQASAAAGPYWYAIPADETGTVNAAHATWPRKDILWVRIDDPGETDGSFVPAIVTGYTAGTAAASPAVPATPARAMRLATISVPLSGGGSPTITFDAPFMAAAGVLDPAVTAVGVPTGAFTTAATGIVNAPAVIGDGVKKFKITFAYTEAYSTVNGDICRFAIRNALAIIGPYQDVTLSTTWGNGRTMVAFDTPAAGAVSYSGSGSRVVGSGALTVSASQVIVEHIA